MKSKMPKNVLLSLGLLMLINTEGHAQKHILQPPPRDGISSLSEIISKIIRSDAINSTFQNSIFWNDCDNPKNDTTKMVISLVRKWDDSLDLFVQSTLKSGGVLYAGNYVSKVKANYYSLLALFQLTDRSSYSFTAKALTDSALKEFILSDGSKTIYELYGNRAYLANCLYEANLQRSSRRELSSPLDYENILASIAVLKTKPVRILCTNVKSCNIYIGNEVTPISTTDTTIRFPVGRSYLICLKKDGYESVVRSLNLFEKNLINIPDTLVFNLRQFAKSKP
jgi:hypothetical protein